MQNPTYIAEYPSPIGNILLEADNTGLTALRFTDAPPLMQTIGDVPILSEVRRWLDIYFSRQVPDFLPSIHLSGSSFQMTVWNLLLQIPYGQTTTYGAIAQTIADQRSIPRMSAQAVGGAVGRNPISILVPCHRVIGADGSLTGYGGGLDKKTALLQLEGIL